MYSVPHKITLVGALDLPYRFRFSLFYSGFSGAPYTYRITGDANADGLTAFGGPMFNDPMYVPRNAADITLEDPGRWEALDSYIESRPCLREQRGQLLLRNSCRDPWVSVMNARFSKVIPTASGQSIELIADLFNVLNLIDGDWGVRRFIEETRILRLVGYDAANGRGIYAFDTQDPNIRDHEATRWRMQLGARYTF